MERRASSGVLLSGRLVAKKGTGLSREPRIRAKQTATLEAYAEQAASIGGNPEADRRAMIAAVERGGYTRATTDRAKVAQFLKLWKSDEARAYLCELWGAAVEEDHDPVALAMRMVHEHMVQNDPKWGPPDRSVSLSATRVAVQMFIPQQTSKVATLNLSAKVERPAEFDVEPVMQSRTILPAGQTIQKPTGPTGRGDDDEAEEDEAEEDDE
jgi:hypothetical protein